MRPLTRLAIVAAVQVLFLLGIVGFNQYTVWTGETVVLRVLPVDASALLRGGGNLYVRYEISTVDLGQVAGDDEIWDRTVYVELREGGDGTWGAVAIHNDRESAFDGTVLIKGKLTDRFFSPQSGRASIRYGIEEIFIQEGSGAFSPAGADRTVAVEVRVDRFGNAVPRRFLVDGEPFDLGRR